MRAINGKWNEKHTFCHVKRAFQITEGKIRYFELHILYLVFHIAEERSYDLQKVDQLKCHNVDIPTDSINQK